MTLMVMNSRFYSSNQSSHHQSFYQEFEHHRLRSHHQQDNPTPANSSSANTTNSEAASPAITCGQAQNGFWSSSVHQNGHFSASSEYFCYFMKRVREIQRLLFLIEIFP